MLAWRTLERAGRHYINSQIGSRCMTSAENHQHTTPATETLTPAALRACLFLHQPTAKKSLSAATLKARSVSGRPPKTACPRRLVTRMRSQPRATRLATTCMLRWLNNCFVLGFLKAITALLARSPSENVIAWPKMIDFNDAPKLDNNSILEASINKPSLKKRHVT